MLLTVSEIADLCTFADAHHAEPDTEIIVMLSPGDGIQGVRTKHCAYCLEYPDEGARPIGSEIGGDDG